MKRLQRGLVEEIMRVGTGLRRRVAALMLMMGPGMAVGVSAGRADLISAVQAGDLQVVRDLVRQKVNVDAARGDGMTPLHWAVHGGDEAIVQVLIQAGADLNARSARGLTPLLLAAGAPGGQIVRVLLKAGANPNLASAVGTTPLMRAAAAGDVAAMATLLDHGAHVDAKETARHHTALMFAAAHDRSDAIRLLAARGASLDDVSRTVANVSNLIDDDGNPIPAASRTGGTRRQSRGDGFANGLGGRSALQLAAREGHVASAKALVEAGADINRVNPLDGSTALIVAIVNGHYDLAAYLLANGANPTASMKDGLTALYATLESRWAPVSWTPTAFTDANGILQQQTDYLDLMKALLARGADPNARLSRSLWFSPPHHNVSWVRTAGARPFWRAAQANDLAAMKLLLNAGANPRDVTDDGTTAIAAAAGVGWAGNFSTTAPDALVPTARFLVDDIGLDLNTANAAGYTPLMGAAWRGANELITYLAEKGAKLDTRNRRGWSATDMANGPFIRGSQVPVKYPATIALLTALGAPQLIASDDEVLGGGSRGTAGGRQDSDAQDPDASDDLRRTPDSSRRGDR